MKKYIIKFLLVVSLISFESCNDKLDVEPQAALDPNTVGSQAGLRGLIVSAYSALDGWLGWDAAAPWATGVSNWVYGDVASDDATKGGGFGDQGDINSIDLFVFPPSLPYFNEKWIALYDGIARSNDVIIAAKNAKNIGPGSLTEDDKVQFTAEGRFLRAFFHFEAKKIFGKVPFMDEVDVETANYTGSNTEDIYPRIEEDLIYAAENLPSRAEYGADAGRVTFVAAQSLLAKVYMFQGKYALAKPLLQAVLDNSDYDLHPNFEDNFRIATKNGKESIFALQSSVRDNTNDNGHSSLNANWGDILAHPAMPAYGGAPGMQQPTFNLVNAFKTGVDGLPLFDTFNNTDINNEVTTPGAFTEYAGELDPRLDFSVGRRGIPFLGHGDHPGSGGVREPNMFGPFTNRKNNFNMEEAEAGLTGQTWTGGISALNYNIIRFADVILWRAEVAAREGDLDIARQLVNRLRVRAKNGGKVTEADGTTPAANYKIEQYPAGHTKFATLEGALEAVQFEKRLEFALEGHRFFDLVRWGIASEVLNKYLAEEAIRLPLFFSTPADFEEGVHEYFPIPTVQIDRSMVNGSATLIQNSGY